MHMRSIRLPNDREQLVSFFVQIEQTRNRNDPPRRTAAAMASKAHNRHVRFEKLKQLANQRKNDTAPPNTEEANSIHLAAL
mmetsp:Transcript_12019/g.20374  ORF Transcript_12019/g.20374 Transcript_12019/m.20374 type:complete len:81 (-) Transcript_12019:201-443(-)